MSELFDEYRDKLNKRRERFEFFWRLRLLWLAIVVVCLAFVATMMGIAGSVTEIDAPAEFEYGRPLAARVKTVFGRASGVVYRAKGASEWSETEPILAGEYEARPYGMTVFGTRHYGKPVSYTILPAPTTVSVTDVSLVYGMRPTFTANLKYDDTVVVDAFVAEKVGERTVNVSFKEDDVHILSASGSEVTSSYSVTAVEKILTDLRRAVTVVTDSAEYVYDGQPHTAPIGEIGGDGLIAGHRFVADTTFITDVGSATNATVDARILDENGEDVTERYNINYVLGSVTVLPRPITVELPSAEFTYDAEAHEFTTFSVTDGEPVEGHEVTLSDTLSVTSAGEYINSPTVRILGSDGTDVTGNYALTTTPGRVKILRRAVTVSTGSHEFTYDGKPHTYDDATVSGDTPLVEGHTLSLSRLLTATNAGEYNNAPTINIVADGADVTRNYEITTEFGTVRVNKLHIGVSTGDDTIPYDAAEHEYREFTVDEETQLADGQSARLKTFLTVKNADTYENELHISVIVDDNETDVTDNYDIQYTYGTITVTRVAVTFASAASADGFSAEYDGDEKVVNDWSVTVGSLASMGHRLTVHSSGISDVCLIEQYMPHEGDFFIRDDAEDVTGNYDVTFLPVRFEITKRAVTLTADSGEFTYDGLGHSVEHFSDVEGRLVAGHSVSAEYSSFVGAGEHVNSPTSPKIVDAGGNDVTANYQPDWQDGNITINKREVHLVTGSGSWTYDGDEHSVRSYQKRVGTEYDLLDGHVVLNADGSPLEYASVMNRTDVRGVENSITGAAELHVFAEYGEGEDVTENYKIDWDYGTLTIGARGLSVTTHGAEFVYDGEDHEETGYDVAGLVGEEGGSHTHEFSADIESVTVNTVTERTENHLVFNGIKITDESGEDVTDNYDTEGISYVYGNLSVSRRRVTVVTENNEDERLVYDGREHYYRNIEHGFDLSDGADADALNGRFTVTPQQFDPFVDANETGYDNETFVKIEKADEDVTDNFEIEYEFGKIVILRRHITVTTESREFVYDGSDHLFEEVTVNEDTPMADGQILRAGGFKAFNRVSDSGTNAYGNIDVYAEGDDDGRALTANYVIEHIFGEVTVNKRPVTFASSEHRDGYSVVYDAKPHSIEDWVQDECPEGTEPGDYGVVDGHTTDFFNISYGDAMDEFDYIPYRYAINAGETEVTDNYEIVFIPVRFVISRRVVKLHPVADPGQGESEDLVYDGKEHFLSAWAFDEGELVEGHEISADLPPCKNVRGVEGYGDESKDYVRPIISIDDEGGPVRNWDSNYDITITPGTLIIRKRNLVASLTAGEGESGTVEFDGAEHTLSRWQVTDGSLADGQHIENDPISFMHVNMVDGEVAAYDVLPDNIRILDEAGEDVTDNYEHEFVKGSLTIARRKVTLKLIPDEMKGESETVEFDGEEHTLSRWEGDDMLVLDHRVEANIPSYLYFTDGPQSCAPEVEPRIVGLNAEQWEIDYDVTWDYMGATLEITKRKIKVITATYSWVYDGEEHYIYDEDFPIEPFTFEGGKGTVSNERMEHKLFVTVPSYVKTVDQGEVDNEFHVWVVADLKIEQTSPPHFTDWSENYDVEFENGKISVTKRPINIHTGSAELEYNGKEQFCTEYEYDNLVEGHSLDFTPSGYTKLKNVDYAFNEFTFTESDWSVSDEGGEDVTVNYEINMDNSGILHIYGKALTVKTPSATWVYDGQQHSLTEGIEYEGLLEGDSVVSDNVGDFEKINHASTKDNVLEVSPEIHDASGEDVSANYIIGEYEYGQLVITPRNIRITSLDAECVYGQKFTEEEMKAWFTVDWEAESEWNYSDFEARILPDWVVLAPADGGNAYAALLKPGDHVNTIIRTVVIYHSIQTLNPNGGDFVIDFVESGTVTVSPRKLTIAGDSQTYVHDGAAHSPTFRVLGAEEAGEDENLYGIAENFAFIGEEERFSFDPESVTEITDEHGEITFRNLSATPHVIYSFRDIVQDRTDWYDITVIEGSVRIKAPITISLGYDQQSYKNRSIVYDAECCDIVGLPVELDASDIEVVFGETDKKFIEVGEYSFDDFRSGCIVRSRSNPETVYFDGWNYSVQPEFRVDFDLPDGKPLRITPRVVTIKMATYFADNKGVELIWDEDVMGQPYSFQRGSLLPGHTLVYTMGRGLDPEEAFIFNRFATCEIHNAEGEIVSHNYELTFVDNKGVLAWNGSSVPEDYI